MPFNGLFYVALTIFSLGLLFKVSGWFRYSLDAKSEEIPPAKRVSAAIRGVLLTLFSTKILTRTLILALNRVSKVPLIAA